MQEKVKKLVEALSRREIKAEYVPDRDGARQLIGQLIPAGSTVGIGGSVTVQELDLEQMLKEKQCQVYWHWKATSDHEGDALKRQASTASYYLCSANAVTGDGRLVNIDGSGNRVSSMVFGPGTVIVVIGVNKIVPGLEEAVQRIKNVTCPLNARRLKRNTPCARENRCLDCGPPGRMCNITTIIEGRPSSLEMHLVVVGEALGY